MGFLSRARNGVIGEDWLAVWLGGLVIALVLLGLGLEAPKFRWASDGEYASTVSEKAFSVERFAEEADTSGEPALAAAATGLRESFRGGERAKVAAAARELRGAAKKAKTASFQKTGEDLGKKFEELAGSPLHKVFSEKNLWAAAKLGVALFALTALGLALMGGNVGRYLLAFPVVYGLSLLAQAIAGNVTMQYYGLEYVIFGLLIGLFVSNVLGVPGWLKEAVRTEYYIKTGLVILGAGILFSEVVQAGALGILQALLVIAVVWYACFWIARWLRVDDEFAAMLSTAVSICGVSAAIAACGAIQGDKRKLSYVTSIVLIVAAPMMVAMPWAVRAWGIPDVVAGAWLGGTLDTSGSVVAAGALISQAAMKMGIIVKFSQNALIGVAAFLLSIWWTFRTGAATGERPKARVIWERFPKFVLGFMAASFVFSFLLGTETVAATKGLLTGLRTTFFALAFVCIGLETRFTDLVSMEGGRPALAFVLAQSVNVVWTLVVAYLIFGGLIFAVPLLK
jgi:uncharacterized membrane protein YadS